MLSPQAFLRKQWLEKFLEGCQLPLPLASQPGGEGGGAAGVLGPRGLLQDCCIAWHPEGGFLFILGPQLQEGWVSSVVLECRVCSLQGARLGVSTK